LLICFILAAIKLFDRPEPGLQIFPQLPEVTDHSKIEALRFSVYEVLFDFGIRVDWIAGDSESKTVRVPADLPLVEPYCALAAKFRQLGGKLLRADVNPFGDRAVIEVGLKKERILQITLESDPRLARSAGKIAVVIDDFGYSFSTVIKGFLNLDYPITFAILPGLEHSAAIADSAFARNREVIIHLPMEPKNGKVNKDEYILLTQMDEQEIRQRVRRAMAAIPHARGLNNHMGSLATEDGRVLAPMMDEIKNAGLFFLDSRTDNSSQAYTWAQKLNIPSGINDTFLDAIREEPFIREQINLLAEISARQGSAIGIGHPEKLTFTVLRDELPKLEKRGFKFVSISEVIKVPL
jgi:polysaccharide deacetylase 2 family uncharacterized protein YibQ